MIAPKNQPFKNLGHIASLDGLRAVSIIIVFVAHVFKSLPVPGGLGVTIFFFISGYLITTLLLREYSNNHTINFRDFYLRRFFRLAPPALITLTIGALLVIFGFAEGTLDPIGLLSQIFFFFNYWDAFSHQQDVISGTKIFWSLSVEEHFYFVFPGLMGLLLARNSPTWVLAGIAILALPWRIIKYNYLGYDEWQVYALSDTRYDSMLWGCFLAVISVKNAELLSKLSEKFWNISAILSCFIIVITLAIREEVFRSTLRYTLQGLALMPIFFYVVNFEKSLPFKILNSFLFRKIGNLSYTIYLVHYIIINMLVYNNITQTEVETAILSAVITLAYSAIIFRFVEIPARLWRVSVSERLARANSHSGNQAISDQTRSRD